MSKETVVAKRYAKALFEVAQGAGAVSQVETELKLVVGTVEGDAEFKKFLSYPNIDATAKIGLVKKAFEGSVSPAVMSTIELLIARGRQSIFAELLEAYVKIAGEVLGQADATVFSALPLTESELAHTAESFGKLTGKKIRLQNVIDKGLLGGIQVRIGDRLYDGSLSGKLSRLEKSLKSQAL